MSEANSCLSFLDCIWTEEDMNEKGNKELQAMHSLLLIFRGHPLWIHWALWHATLRSVAPSRLQTRTMASLPPTVHGDIADVPQAGKGTCLPSCLQWVILCKVLSFSLRTCSVLFQFMSTAGPLARCSEFNERNDLGRFFFFLIFFIFCARQKIGQRAHKGNWWLI